LDFQKWLKHSFGLVFLGIPYSDKVIFKAKNIVCGFFLG
ncbi:unnamed protein product, partial [marine sediment metagenome]